MSTKTTLGLTAIMVALVSGCDVSVRTPGVVVAAPAPVVEVAPPAYVWDGVEFVGEYNGGFVYMNPAGVWVACDPIMLERFHGWERGHPDWRRSAVPYDRAHRPDPHNMRREERR
jgi:hypothetical protein